MHTYVYTYIYRYASLSIHTYMLYITLCIIYTYAYICIYISYEGVLVTWQLDTGYRQFLPRLGGAVIALANSSCGTVVAVLCDDDVIQVKKIQKNMQTRLAADVC
jgi:hypothetical protein